MPNIYDSLRLVLLCLPIAVAAVHLAFALAIYYDACHLEDSEGALQFVGPRVWAIAVLVFGLFAVLVYWLMHHSALRRLEYASSKQL